MIRLERPMEDCVRTGFRTLKFTSELRLWPGYFCYQKKNRHLNSSNIDIDDDFILSKF